MEGTVANHLTKKPGALWCSLILKQIIAVSQKSANQQMKTSNVLTLKQLIGPLQLGSLDHNFPKNIT